MSNSWDNVLLPPGYAYGFVGGPAHDTRIVRMDGGGEQRVVMREEPQWRWSALRKNFRDGADVEGLEKFLLARKGAYFGFLFLDPRDYSTSPNGNTDTPTALDQIIGYGDGSTTRFRLRKEYEDPAGMTARAFPRRVVPLLGTASAPVARLLGVATGASIAPTVSVDGVPDGSATFLPLSMEVELSAAPGIGDQVTWGGYFAVPARFGDATDKGFEAAITGFAADEATFEIESIPFDDPVPLVPGGFPYGYRVLTDQVTDFELSARDVYLYEVDADAAINAWLDNLVSYPTGGPHLEVWNTGTSTITVRDVLGNSVGDVIAGEVRRLFVKESGGILSAVLI